MFAVLLLAACASGNDAAETNRSDSHDTDAVDTDACGIPAECPLREVAGARDVLIGAAVEPGPLASDAAFAQTLASEFNSVTPENALKWGALHPEPDTWVFEPADAIVAFAADHDLAVKGHTLVWDSPYLDTVPGWVEAIQDPAALRAVLQDHITTVMTHFDTVDRWDVVNEPFLVAEGALYEGHFYRVLGPDYIAEVFRMARAADPDARLYLNENSVEYVPEKGAALLDLITQLVAGGVPIDGVGLQMHLFNGAPAPGVVAEMVEAFTDLGLEVAITELDVPLREGDDLAAQAEIYEQVLGECLDAGCRDITLWGFTDRYSWINSSYIGPGRQPLIFDGEYAPKPAYAALWRLLAAESGPDRTSRQMMGDSNRAGRVARVAAPLATGRR